MKKFRVELQGFKAQTIIVDEEDVDKAILKAYKVWGERNLPPDIMGISEVSEEV